MSAPKFPPRLLADAWGVKCKIEGTTFEAWATDGPTEYISAPEVEAMLIEKETQLRKRYDALLSALTLRDEKIDDLLREERAKAFEEALAVLDFDCERWEWQDMLIKKKAQALRGEK